MEPCGTPVLICWLDDCTVHRYTQYNDIYVINNLLSIYVQLHGFHNNEALPIV